MAVACQIINESFSNYPFYNEESTIEDTLEALYAQTYQPDEVLLVDSGSIDNTSKIIDKWINIKGTTIYKIIFDGNMSPSSSINKGIKNSTNELIAYIDCGLKIPRKWIEENLIYMKKNNIDIVSNCIYTVGENIIDKSFISQTTGMPLSLVCQISSKEKNNYRLWLLLRKYKSKLRC